MKRSPGLVAPSAGILGAALLMCSAPVLAAEPTVEESDCQEQTAGKIVTKFVLKKTLIVTKCEKGARKVPPTNPRSDCIQPYAGETATKIADAQAKAEDKIIDKCSTTDPDGCPECYDGSGDCSMFAGPNVDAVEVQVDAFRDFIYCDDSGSGDGLNPDEAKCIDTIGKTLAKGLKKAGKCGAKCIDADRDADGTTGTACAPPYYPDPHPGEDPDLRACAQTLAEKGIAKIDDKCAADLPECHTIYTTGESWFNLLRDSLTTNYPTYFCQDP